MIDDDYRYGYGPTSQEVLIPAFLAAYGKKDVDKVTLETFPSYFKMLPNWRIKYDGLSKIPVVKKHIRSINLNHAYRSTYNIGSYTTNLSYNPDSTNKMTGNYYSKYDIYSVSIHSVWLLNLT